MKNTALVLVLAVAIVAVSPAARAEDRDGSLPAAATVPASAAASPAPPVDTAGSALAPPPAASTAAPPMQRPPRPPADAAFAQPTTLPVSGSPLATGLPRRHHGKRLVWDPAFNRMDAPEIVVTSIAAAVALAGAVAPPLKTGWTGGILFDDAARRALRLSSYQARLDIRDASDVGLAFVTSFPFLVDSVIVAYWYRGSDDVALQMALIDAEAMAVSAALQGTANFLSGRARPYVADCGGEISRQTIDCQTNSQHRSFFSGHSALSFTSAALICAHHLSLDLFESAADPVTCVSGFVAASAVATFRVMGDVHYLSDAIVGGLVGTAVGLGFPLLHHYRRSRTQPVGGVQLRFVPTPNGAQIVGTF